MDVVTLALAKNFTKDTVKGMGALKGASCTISSVNEVENGTEITFRYEDNTGAEHFETIFVKNGVDGKDGVDGSGNGGEVVKIAVGYNKNTKKYYSSGTGKYLVELYEKGTHIQLILTGSSLPNTDNSGATYQIIDTTPLSFCATYVQNGKYVVDILSYKEDSNNYAIWNRKKTTLIEEKTNNLNTCSIFQRVCCIGDSMTAGYIRNDGDSVESSLKHEKFAWPHFLSKITGNDYVNLGISGASAKTWLESEDGLNALLSTGDAQAYLVGLGMNDSSLVDNNGTFQKTERYIDLGTPEDIENENPDTFYGTYSKLIREIYNLNPLAKIFVFTMFEDLDRGIADPSNPENIITRADYNTAIEHIVNLYKTRETNPMQIHILDLRNYIDWFTTDSIINDRLNGHQTALGYQQFAEIICKIWSKYIADNLHDFQDVHKIPYEYIENKLVDEIYEIVGGIA